jgi:hypothetical protein
VIFHQFSCKGEAERSTYCSTRVEGICTQRGSFKSYASDDDFQLVDSEDWEEAPPLPLDVHP